MAAERAHHRRAAAALVVGDEGDPAVEDDHPPEQLGHRPHLRPHQRDPLRIGLRGRVSAGRVLVERTHPHAPGQQRGVPRDRLFQLLRRTSAAGLAADHLVLALGAGLLDERDHVAEPVDHLDGLDGLGPFVRPGHMDRGEGVQGIAARVQFEKPAAQL